MDKTLIVMPTYNEADNIEAVLKAISAYDFNIDVLVVDDNSPDGTAVIVEELSKENFHIHLLRREGKLGLGTAYIAGFKYGLAKGYSYIMQMDADFSHDPKYLPDFLREIKKCDLVLGSRYVKGGGVVNWGVIRKLISRGGSFYARNILGVRIKDFTTGFKCFTADSLKKIDLDSIYSNGFSFSVESTYRVIAKGMRVKEIPIIFVDRRVGQSKMSKRIFLEALIAVWKLKFTKF